MTPEPIPPLRVALLSRWHVHADDYAREARQIDGLEIATVWDEEPARGRAWAEELQVPFEEDLTHLLADATIDAVIVTTPTHAHRDVLVRAADAGKHIFSEKVLAGTTEDAEAILAAVDAAGVELMLSLPKLCGGAYLAAQAALDRGDLGRLVSVRCRVAHDGAVPQDGASGWLPERFFDASSALGGALIDLGAHPIYLCNRLAGKPEEVSAMLLDVMGRGVDDTSTVLVRYDGAANGDSVVSDSVVSDSVSSDSISSDSVSSDSMLGDSVLGVIETGFANAGCTPLLELHGTRGTFLAEDGRARVRQGRDPWQERTQPAPLASPMRQWLAAIRDGTPPFITRRDMLDLTRVNEAAARAARERRHVSID